MHPTHYSYHVTLLNALLPRRLPTSRRPQTQGGCICAAKALPAAARDDDPNSLPPLLPAALRLPLGDAHLRRRPDQEKARHVIAPQCTCRGRCTRP